MAFDVFTAVLTASDFPFVTDFFSRTVIIPGIDNPPHIPRSYTGDDSKNAEIAQHYYAQNVMPTSEGLMSIGFMQITPGIPGKTDFDQAITLRDEDENNFMLSPSRGKNYIYTANAGVWKSINPFVASPNILISRSYVNGRSFVCYQRDSIREYVVAANTFLPVPFILPPGMTINDIDCIGNSNNYLLWASNITVGWSSLIDPTDLNPNIQTGAGFAIPQDVKGPVRAIAATAGGFLIYTTKNVVAAMYTNNARAPFIFREVSGAGGVQNPEQVSTEASLKEQYAWTTAGLQKVSVNAADVVSAAASDFLAGRILESFNLTTLVLTLKRLNADLKIKVAFISNRYLVVSYGEDLGVFPQVYSHAIINDTHLKRWGKVRIDHVDCFPYPYPNLIGSVTDTPPKRSLAFLQRDGTVQLMLMDYRIRQDQGVLLLGRYQLTRGRMITFQQLEIESTVQAYPPNAYLLISYDGKNNETPIPLQVLSDGDTMKRYGVAPPDNETDGARPRTGTNLSTLFTGRFEFATAVFNITRHGSR